MTLAALRLRNASQDDLNVVSATAPGCLAALTTCCSAAHNLLPSPISIVDYLKGDTAINRRNDLALERHLARNQCDCRTPTRLAFCRYDK
jgi:hypothetical protein